MDGISLHTIMLVIQRCVSSVGILVILMGVVTSVYQYIVYLAKDQKKVQGASINPIRLNLSRSLILGLEFIVAADLIGTTSTPDYYAVGMLAIIVLVRTVLSFTINREIMWLSKEK